MIHLKNSDRIEDLTYVGQYQRYSFSLSIMVNGYFHSKIAKIARKACNNTDRNLNGVADRSLNLYVAVLTLKLSVSAVLYAI